MCLVSTTVHPRAGGEHVAARAPRAHTAGSSPRGRGTRAPGPARHEHDRFIPARAGNTLQGVRDARPGPVHPRAGGEHVTCQGPVGYAIGSSPRGRGTPARRRDRRRVPRFIPARAGNTFMCLVAHIRSPVHPRAGGEHAPSSRRTQRRAGSSPRGRGTRAPGPARHEHDRFIPARAGNTSMNTPSPVRLTVHPRAGGEHKRTSPGARSAAGSSPRGRGTRLGTRVLDGHPRFIPARAGNTRPRPQASGSATVHPRAGGEHCNETEAERRDRGSSPRGRGTHSQRDLARDYRRFIPARAGNTWVRRPWGDNKTVHPRAGGEHGRPESQRYPPYGSSPRGRGTPAPEPGTSPLSRFIPARAGNTHRSSPPPLPLSVHPRAGGEHRYPALVRSAHDGSSPRGRGTLIDGPRLPAPGRFIPARAGNTRRCPRPG